MNEELNMYKDFPEGSGGKRRHDFGTLSFKDWVKKYCAAPNLSAYEGFLKWAKLALVQSEEFHSIWNKGRIQPYNYDLISHAYVKLRNENLFDDDVNLFIAFLAGDGFFEVYNTELESWICSTNWQNPSKDCLQLNTCLLMEEIAPMEFGMNYIRESLGNLDYWRQF